MATRRKQKTNTAWLRDLMEFSDSGALMQAFVLTAIEKYAAQCIDAGPERFESGMFSGAVWVRTATEAQRRLNEHLGRTEGGN